MLVTTTHSIRVPNNVQQNYYKNLISSMKYEIHTLLQFYFQCQVVLDVKYPLNKQLQINLLM